MQLATRVIGAMRMDAATYEAIEADPAAMRQAVVVVAGFGVAAGVGLAGSTPTMTAMVIAAACAIAGWLSWAALVYHIGVRLMPESRTRSDTAEVARTIGFAAAPGLLFALLLVPIGRPVTFTVVSIWMVATMVVAVRQALDFTHLSRAVAVCVAAWIAVALVVVAMGFAFGPLVS